MALVVAVKLLPVPSSNQVLVGCKSVVAPSEANVRQNFDSTVLSLPTSASISCYSFFSFTSSKFVNKFFKLTFSCLKILAQVNRLRWQWHILPGKEKDCLKLLGKFFTESFIITLSCCCCFCCCYQVCCNSPFWFSSSYFCSVPNLCCVFQRIILLTLIHICCV
jgi:hypothetical protein